MEHISKPIERVMDKITADYQQQQKMQRVWRRYEQAHGLVNDSVKLLAEAALSMELEK